MGTTTAKANQETPVRGARILVAEDDESFRGFVTQALTWSGFRVETSINGDDVLARLERLERRDDLPDLLLTDVQMPGTDGLKLLCAARDRWPSLPVILMTCYGDHEVLREALRIGCHGFIDKPFTVSELDAVIRKTLAEHQRLQASLTAGGTNDWMTGSGRFRLPEERERIGNYEVLEEIARGSMGVVYKASQVGLDRLVALKVTRQGAGDGMFLREARAMARLRHPNIAVVHEVGVDEGIEFFTMEFVDGCSLAERLREAPLAPPEAVEILAAVADGLAHVHAFDILHRDLKPSNILISGGDGEPLRPVLVDFGIATDKRSGVEPEGYLEGTLNYMAPEYAGGAAYDERCDIYSFGVVLYEALAGRGKLPHWQPVAGLASDPALGPQLVAQRFASSSYQPIEDRVEGVTPALAAVVAQAVAKDRLQRFATGRELADALRAVVPYEA